MPCISWTAGQLASGGLILKEKRKVRWVEERVAETGKQCKRCKQYIFSTNILRVSVSRVILL